MQPKLQRIHESAQRISKCFLVVVSVVTWVAMTSAVSFGQPAQENEAAAAKAAPLGQKWALLIGVDHYLDPRLGNLRFCGADAQALRDVLVRQGGFPADQVIVLHDQEKEPGRQPLRLSIERSLKALLAQAGPQDLVLVSFSGHGIQVGETAYLCPTEAELDKPEATMVSVAALYETLSKECHAAQKIVFVDACRKPMESGQRAPQLDLTKGFSERLRQVPEGLLILSSCKSGQLSYEEKELGHGVFAHYLLEGLNGKADARGPDLRGNGDGRIDVDELFNYASTHTGKYVLNKFTEAQTPELYGVRRGPIDLLAALPDVREILDKALRTSRLISDESSSARSLIRIAEMRAKVGDKDASRLLFGEALRMVRMIKDESPKALALNSIAVTQSKVGEKQAARLAFEEALRTAGSISAGEKRASTLGVIAEEQDMAGDFASALEAARAITDPNWAAYTFANIAGSFADTGDTVLAKATIREAIVHAKECLEPGKVDYAFRAFAWVAIAQARSGLASEALATVRDELLPRWEKGSVWSHGKSATARFCRVQVRNDAATQLYELASRIPDSSDQVIVLVCLAEAILAEQKPAIANNITAFKETKSRHEWVRCGLADFSLDFSLDFWEGPEMWFLKLWFTKPQMAGRDGGSSRQIDPLTAFPNVREILDKALQAARSVSDEGTRAECLVRVASAQFKAGNNGSARLTLGDAIRTSSSIRQEVQKSSALSTIALAQARTGDFNNALQTVRSHNDKYQPTSELSAIAYEQAKGGELASSLVTARSLKMLASNPSVGTYFLTLTGIAAAQADSGDQAAAKATIHEALTDAADLINRTDDNTIGLVACAAFGQAKSGFTSEALVSVRDILLPRWPKDGLPLDGLASSGEPILSHLCRELVTDFCREQVKHGAATETYELASSIPNASDQVLVLVCLAEAILEEQKLAVAKISSDTNQPAK